MTTETQETKFFVPLKGQFTKNGKPKMIPVIRTRRNVTLTHDKGETVTFSTYKSRGQARFKDSRLKTSYPIPGPIIAEMSRMLQLPPETALQILQVS
jgi:hypothetical protein